MTEKLDIATNRKARKWGKRAQFARVIWALLLPLFVLSPRPLWVWRRIMLRMFGAEIGDSVHVYPNVRITMPWNLKIDCEAAIGDRAILYALGHIRIGARATVSQGVHVCAGSHDISRPDRPLVQSSITIEEDTWVAADAFVGPGITVGAGAVVGARSVVVSDIPPNVVAAGNPARVIRPLSKVRD